MKTNLLFVIDSLDCAGAEKSLVTLLNLIDYEKYNVDLQLFAYGGLLQELVPEEVNVLNPLGYSEFSTLDYKKAIFYSVKYRNIMFLNSRLKYSAAIRAQKYSHPQKARIFWQCVSQTIEETQKVYDIAISYAQGVPTFYVAEKVKAKKKFAWVNVSYRLNAEEGGFQQKYYNEFNKIVAVSEKTEEIFLETFPKYSNQTTVIYDINNPHFISKMADIGNNYEDSFDGVRILTIGRLAHQKGYDVALRACKQLKEQGIHFRWYALGKGPLEEEVKTYIKENGLENHFKLLGVKGNPYPFIKNADLYVQTSRYEGFGLAIAEARMLNVPVVSTRFDAVYSQMVEGKNGLVVDMDPDQVCTSVIKLITDGELRTSIVSYLKAEKKGNLEELDKFYQLLEESEETYEKSVVHGY